MTLFRWSQTAASNGTADATCPFPEGMAPSALNDGTRGMMAAVAKYRDDIAGAIVTAGTNVAYTVSSYEGFDTLAHLSGQMIAFSPHATNGAGPVTLNVDSLGAKALRTSPGVELLAGTIIQGTPYVAVYNNSDGAFYLQSFFGANPYLIPLGAGMDYWLPTAPNSSFVFPIGQAISRTTYATLFAAMGTTYGAGDGSTTFNLPDKTGRASVMKEAVATRLTAAGFGGNSANLGAVGGAEKETVAQANLPNISLGVTGSASVVSTATNVVTGGVQNFQVGGGGSARCLDNTGGAGQISSTGSISGTAALGGSGTALPTVQPTIVCNYILRVI